MPSPRHGISYYRRKGVEEKLLAVAQSIRNIRGAWVLRVRDETDEKLFRRRRDMLAEELDLQLESLRIAIGNLRAMKFATYFDIKTMKWIQLTPARDKRRREKGEEAAAAARFMEEYRAKRAEALVAGESMCAPVEPWGKAPKVDKPPEEKRKKAALKREKAKRAWKKLTALKASTKNVTNGKDVNS